mmetsp:Transcript_85529/g.169728  ORF Transcript_85529/g.169728 Transcript_85529/m.169728 type:complete len:478 (+) Transcript_85529:80-1513(+)
MAPKNKVAEGGSLRQRGGDKKKPETKEPAPQDPEDEDKSNLQGEWGSILILLVLYTLQGLPMGLSGVIPMMLKERGVSFSDVGFFSLNTWPFSLKILWAPIVDTWYIARVGRRKSWMVPCQLAIGAMMLWMSTSVDGLLYTDKPRIVELTVIFLALYFLCATQDIAVDGWALTMLRPENVGWAATCNAAGQTFGYAIGFTGYMMLEQMKVVTLAQFMFALGAMFIVVTILVALFKTENPVPPEDEPEDIVTSYRHMISILKLRPVQTLIVILATWKMAFPITDAVAPLKFQEYGIPKEHLAYLTSLIMPIYILVPVFATKWTTGTTPLNIAMAVYPCRVALVAITAALAYLTPSSLEPFPWAYYGALLVFGVVGAVVSELVFTAQMAFFARVSDPAYGGTYMTLLNTLGNLGGKWPPTVTFYLVDALTCKGATCAMQADGFYVVSAFCTVVGLVWYALGSPFVHRIQQQKLDDWKIR